MAAAERRLVAGSCGRRARRLAGLLLALAIAGTAAAREDPAGGAAGSGAAGSGAAGGAAEAGAVEEGGPGAVDRQLCAHIAAAAAAHGLPEAFLTRLIWRESSFRSDVVSPKGAQGIAQFMPGTAADRGLADPFDPASAIPAAAALIADHRARFGNLGLAAAAYNAGEARVTGWLAGTGGLPLETQAFVAFITGSPAPDWKAALGAGPSAQPAPTLEPVHDCAAVVARVRAGLGAPGLAGVLREGPFAPWGVQISGSFSKAQALASYARARGRFAAVLAETQPFVLGMRLRSRGRAVYYRVRVPLETRQAANELCGRLRRAGGACIVLRN